MDINSSIYCYFTIYYVSLSRRIFAAILLSHLYLFCSVLDSVVPIHYAWHGLYKASQVIMHASHAVLDTLQLGNQIAAMYEATIPGSISHINEVVRTVERAQYLCSGDVCTCYIWYVSLLYLIHSLTLACQDSVASV